MKFIFYARDKFRNSTLFRNEKMVVSWPKMRKINLGKVNEKKGECWRILPKRVSRKLLFVAFFLFNLQNQPSRLFVGCLINTLLLLVRDYAFSPPRYSFHSSHSSSLAVANGGENIFAPFAICCPWIHSLGKRQDSAFLFFSFSFCFY